MVDQTQNVLNAFRTEQQAKKQRQIAGFLGQVAQGGEGAESARIGLAGLGPQGVHALGGLGGVQAQQQAVQQSQQEAAMKSFTTNALFALSVDDVELDAATPYLARMAQGAGIQDSVIKGFVNMPVARRRLALQQQLGIRSAKEEGNYIIVEGVNPDTGEPIMGRMDKKTGQFSPFEDITAAGKAARPDLNTYQDKDTGETFTVDENDPEDVRRILDNPSRFVKAPTRAETGEPGAFGLEKGEAKDARKIVISSEENTRKFLGDVKNMKRLIEESPTANTVTARLAAIGSNLAFELQTAGAALGGGAAEDAQRILVDDVGSYRKMLDDFNISNAKVKSAIIGLAYQKALQTNQRVTDKDFKEALREIGASASNPQAFLAVLNETANKAVRNYGATYDTYSRNFPKILKEKAVFEGFGASDAIDYKNMSTEELMAIARAAK